MFIAERTFSLNYFGNNYVLSLLTWPELVNNGSCFCICSVKYVCLTIRLNSRFQCCLIHYEVLPFQNIHSGCRLSGKSDGTSWHCPSRVGYRHWARRCSCVFLEHLPSAAGPCLTLMSQARGIFGCCRQDRITESFQLEKTSKII